MLVFLRIKFLILFSPKTNFSQKYLSNLFKGVIKYSTWISLGKFTISKTPILLKEAKPF